MPAAEETVHRIVKIRDDHSVEICMPNEIAGRIVEKVLGQDAKDIASRSLKDSAVVRLAPGCDIADASPSASEWLLLVQDQ